MIRFFSAAVFLLATPFALAQSSYPARPVKIVVPVTTGGPSDLVARILADKLAGALGKPVVIENVPGASQSIGAGAVAKAEPDGYTLLQAAANMAINPILMPDLRYDTVKDFAPVSLTHLTPYVFVVSSQSSLKSVAELIKHVRDNPGKITYGTTGQGSPQQLATLLLAQALQLRDIVKRLNSELARILGSDEIRKRFEDMGLVARASSPEEFGRFLQSEMTRWKSLLVKKP